MQSRFADSRFGWVPLTPRGVVACALGSTRRWWILQLLVALLCGLTVMWFFSRAWFPVVRRAIQAMPAAGEIRGGVLRWEGDDPVILGSGHFVSFLVDLDHADEMGAPAHVRFEFGTRDVRACSLFGCLRVAYPRAWAIGFNRTELEPWWGARESFLKAGLLLVGTGFVWLSWQILSFLYAFAIRTAARLMGRDPGYPGAYRVAGAAMLSGALIMMITIVGYGLGVFDLVRFLYGTLFHLIVGWLYAVSATFCLPREGATEKGRGNPFSPGPKGKSVNPFKSKAGRKR